MRISAILVESIFRNYPYMDLSQRLATIIALVRAIDPNIDVDVGELVKKARELELLMETHMELYRQGEVDELPIPDELKELYEIENKMLAKFFRFYLRPRGGGVEKFV